MGTYIEVPAADGSGRFRAYLATPAAGKGPGLVLAQEIFGINQTMREVADFYAEEGYTVLAPDLFWRIEPGIALGYSEADWQRAFDLFKRFDVTRGMADLTTAVAALRARPECNGKVGAVGYCLGGKLAYLMAARSGVDCAVGYYGVGIENDLDLVAEIKVPIALHLAAADGYCPPAAQARIAAAFAGREHAHIYVYPGCDHAFARPNGEHYDKTAAGLAHLRTIETLKSAIGPHYDLSALWDKHLEYEFASRDVDATMATMVAEPYVNHIPTLTGGVGYKQLYRFYKHHFVEGNPPDTRLVPVSRTVGASQLVDEVIFSFTHTCEIEWLAPGVKPTGRYVEFPIVAIIQFRGDKLCHEHIYWDQASVLKQMGVLDARALPIAGAEAAKKLVDETLPSNALMPGWSRSAPR